MPISLFKRSIVGAPLSESQFDSNMTEIEDAVNGIEATVIALSTGVDVYVQTSAPTAPIELHSIWIDTTDGNNEFNVWDGTQWVLRRDYRIAELQSAITQEVSDRQDAINQEVIDRQAAIDAVTANVTALDVAMTALQTSLVAAENDISDINSDLAQEVIDRASGDNGLQAQVNVIEGDLAAEYVLVVQGGNRFAGMRLRAATGEGSDIQFQADKFVIVNGSGANAVAPFVVDGGVVYMSDVVIKELAAEKILAGDLKVVNMEALSKFYNATHPSTKFKILEAQIQNPGNHTPPTVTHDFGATGDWFGYDFNHHEPLVYYGQGHPSAVPDKIININNGNAAIKFNARLYNSIGLINVYYRRVPGPAYDTPGPFISIGAWYGPTGGPHTNFTNTYSALGGLLNTDLLEFYCAPCDGSGDLRDTGNLDIRYELDITALNFSI